MDKIEKYLKQLNIQVDNTHKEKVRNEILKFAPQEEKKTLKIPIIFNISAAAAAVIIVAFISVFSYFKFFYNKTANTKSEQTNILEKEKDETKLSDNKKVIIEELEDEGYIDEKLKDGEFELAEKDDKKGESSIIYNEKTERKKELKEEKDFLFSYNKDDSKDYFQGQIKYTNDIYSDYDTTEIKSNDTKDKKTSIDYFENKKKMEMSKSRDSDEKRGLYKKDLEDVLSETEESDKIIKRGREEEKSDFVSTQEFNQLRVIPNKKDDSFKYLNRQIINNKPIDTALIKDEEIINYFGKSDDISVTENLNIEGTQDKENIYFLLVNYKSEKNMADIEVEITFNPNVSAYYAIGYPKITNFTETDRISSTIASNDPVIILTKIKIENKVPELGNVRVLFKEGQKDRNEINKKILSADITNIEDASPIFKKSILAYMIAREAKNKDYSIDDIIDFKAKYIDKDQNLKKSEVNDFLEMYIDNRK